MLLCLWPLKKGKCAMGIKFVVPKDKVEAIRKVLDPLVQHPPNVGSNEKFQDLAFLDYELVSDQAAFAAMAMCNGAQSLHRYE
jgi:hypothetical protein